MMKVYMKIKKRETYKLIILLLLVLNFSCSQKIISFENTSKVTSDYSNLSHYKSSERIDNDVLIVNYNDINLKGVYFDKTTEYWISNQKIISFSGKHENSPFKSICHLVKVFKNNFILVSKSHCANPGAGFYEIKNVLIIDLNTKKTYKSDFGKTNLSFSKSYNDYCCENNKMAYAILNFDLEKKEIILHNNFGKKSVKITPYNKTEF